MMMASGGGGGQGWWTGGEKEGGRKKSNKATEKTTTYFATYDFLSCRVVQLWRAYGFVLLNEDDRGAALAPPADDPCTARTQRQSGIEDHRAREVHPSSQYVKPGPAGMLEGHWPDAHHACATCSFLVTPTSERFRIVHPHPHPHPSRRLL